MIQKEFFWVDVMGFRMYSFKSFPSLRYMNMISWVVYIFSWLEFESVNLFWLKEKADKIEKVFNMKFLSYSGIIRDKFIFNKNSKSRNIFFKKILVTGHFVLYIGRTSSCKNNTQFTLYLKAKIKTNNPNGQRYRTEQQFNNFLHRITISKLKIHIHHKIFTSILWYI